MMNRRKFINSAALGMAACSFLPANLLANSKSRDFAQLTILHTNDMHSHIHPFTSGIYKGLGGVSQRSLIIKKIRKENPNVLLLDAGDIFQGTPYFNVYGGELEFKLMSKMRYDAATIGNHDFDNGLNGLNKQLPHSNFPFIISNYDFSNTILNEKFLKYKVFDKGGIKIGVFGVGVELKGLVPKSLYQDTIYLDPIEISRLYADYLKNKLNCDLVICLSHLGFKYKGNKVSDIVLGKSTRNIDLIIGGHTHTFLDSAFLIKNIDNQNVRITQAGWAGINIGRIDYFFDKIKAVKKCKTYSILIKK